MANRYYYQTQIPVKDAAIVASLPSAAHRRAWISRITDHDGTGDGHDGGTAAWIELARAVGLEEDDVRSERAIAPGTRFAVDAYVTFARTRPWVEAVASSLTELFGPPVMQRRVAAILEKYPWIDRSGLAYFERRIPLAQRDSELALCVGAGRSDDAGTAGSLRRRAAFQMRRVVVHPRRDGAGLRRVPVKLDARPQFGKGVKLRHEPGGRAMLLVPESALSLNAPAAAALELVDGGRTLAEIVDAVVEHFDVGADRARDDLVDLFNRLAERGFIR